jgi:hypothetical protein
VNADPRREFERAEARFRRRFDREGRFATMDEWEAELGGPSEAWDEAYEARREIKLPPRWSELVAIHVRDGEPAAAIPERPPKRKLAELSPRDRDRLEREVASHVASNQPSLRSIAERYTISRYQVGKLIAEARRTG